MKRFLIAIIVLIAAVWVGLKIQANPGYMLLSYGTWTIEMPLWLSIVIVFILFLLIYWLVRMLGSSFALPGRFRHWSNRRRLRHAHELTNCGLIALAEGNWKQAEKKLQRAAANTNTPLINYLALAHAAQEQNAYDRRDSYLRRAHHANPAAEIAVGLTQAQLHLDHKQLEQALATLRHLRELVPHHKYVLKLLKNIYVQLNEWQGLRELLPALKKYKVVTGNALAELTVEVYQKLLHQMIQHSIKSTDSGHEEIAKNNVEQFWQATPKKLRQHSELMKPYVSYLIKTNDTDKHEIAEKLLREMLKKDWQEDLILLYSEFVVGGGKKQLNFAEAMLKNHRNNAVLLLSLGRLCIANQLWGKASSYLETSNAIQPTPTGYYELAKLLDQREEPEKALECYRKGLRLVTEGRRS